MKSTRDNNSSQGGVERLLLSNNLSLLPLLIIFSISDSILANFMIFSGVRLISNGQNNDFKSKKWVTACPLENYSSLHEVSLASFLGWNFKWINKHVFVGFDYNMNMPLNIHPRATLTFHTQKTNRDPVAPHYCYSIRNLKRWYLDIYPYDSHEGYLKSLNAGGRKNYLRSKKIFEKYGCTTSCIGCDWTTYVDDVYRLYSNVACRSGEKLYDLRFFQTIAKRDDYTLLCGWFEGKMIGVLVLQEECPTLHTIACGFDYEHSSNSYAYSWLHHELIHFAIESKKFQNVDVGIMADKSKKEIGFTPVSVRMDIYTKSVLLRSFLNVASYFTSATITPDSKIKISLGRNRNDN